MKVKINNLSLLEAIDYIDDFLMENIAYDDKITLVGKNELVLKKLSKMYGLTYELE